MESQAGARSAARPGAQEIDVSGMEVANCWTSCAAPAFLRRELGQAQADLQFNRVRFSAAAHEQPGPVISSKPS